MLQLLKLSLYRLIATPYQSKVIYFIVAMGWQVPKHRSPVLSLFLYIVVGEGDFAISIMNNKKKLHVDVNASIAICNIVVLEC